MARVLHLALLGLVATAGISLIAPAHAAGTAPVAQAPSLQLPVMPDPVPVQLDASTAAFLALDLNTALCPGLPACAATLPAIADGIAAARASKALVVYSTFNNVPLVPDVMQGADDPLVSSGADKFFNTNLDDILKQHGITTVVIVGSLTNGAVLYTAYGASARGYTVAVGVDGVSAKSDFDTYATEWQLLNGPGTSNPRNTPLQPKAVTLSRLDMITYK